LVLFFKKEHLALPMTRWALKLEYDGGAFVGWQRQAAGVSIQQIFEAAASKLADRPVTSIIAGRTDAGVHAEGQVVHIDLERDIAPDRLASALNFHLKPHRVCVLAAAAVPPDWSARFSAIGRAYRYVISNRRARPALDEGRVWHVPHALNAALMHEAAQSLLGRHDFSSFRAAACQAKTPWRTLDRLDVGRRGDTIEIIAEARSFLHHQVRNMVGTLKLVGDGAVPVAAMAGILEAANRAAAGPTAPADGLFLTAVRYADDPFA
jgi:tRNA pseudouridine38-40 synthase